MNYQVPEGAPADLVCEECERRFAVGYCEDCEEALCAPCLAIMHIPNASGQAHMHLTQVRTLVSFGKSVNNLSFKGSESSNLSIEVGRFYVVVQSLYR